MSQAFFDESLEIPEGLADLFARSRIALSIADYLQKDCPLIGVNDAFLKLSGYGPEDALKANCRFLQPPGGAGPVRERMRRFLGDPTKRSGRFLVPNITRSGKPFLNLLYMTKLTHRGEPRYVLGSQFDVGPKSEAERALYDIALKEDMTRLNVLTDETNWVVLGSLEAIASSHSIIAQTKFE